MSNLRGVNFRFNLKGETEVEGGGVKMSVDYFDMDAFDAKRFQFGINVGANVNIRDFTVGYRFNPDLTDYFGEMDSKTYYHFITVGYHF